MLSKELEVTLNQAFTTAHSKRHEFITVEHLLLALLDNAAVTPVLKACACDCMAIRDELTQFIDETVSLTPENIQRETQPTLGFQRILQRAVFHVQATDKKEVTGANLFVALFSEKDSHAVYILNKYELSYQDVVNFLAHNVPKIDRDKDDSGDVESNPKASVTKSTTLEYKIVLLNDDFTPMDFVVKILMGYFNMNEDQATQVMLQVHTQGVGVCGTFSKDVAEIKVQMINEYSRGNHHPLMCTMEEV